LSFLDHSLRELLLGTPKREPTPKKEKEEKSEVAQGPRLSWRVKATAWLTLGSGLLAAMIGVAGIFGAPGLKDTAVAGHAVVNSVGSGCLVTLTPDWQPPRPLVNQPLPICGLKEGQSVILTVEGLPGANQSFPAAISTKDTTYYLGSSSEAILVLGVVTAVISIALIVVPLATLLHQPTPLLRLKSALAFFAAVFFAIVVGTSLGFDQTSGAHPILALVGTLLGGGVAWSVVLVWRRFRAAKARPAETK
jgi:hypothetical protein